MRDCQVDEKNYKCYKEECLEVGMLSGATKKGCLRLRETQKSMLTTVNSDNNYIK